MTEPARRRATYEDLLAVPRHLVAEIVDGELRTQPRPAPVHIRAASRLGSRLHRFFDEGDGGPGGWWILVEPEVHFSERGDILVPDLAGWRLERMPELPATAWFELAPDWVCEVLSPRTAADDRAEKMPVYARAGVGHVWLLDPLLRTLEVCRREDARWVLLQTVKGDASVRAEPFEAVALDLATLWAAPAERA